MSYLNRQMLTAKESLLCTCPCCGGTAVFLEEHRPDPPVNYHVLFAKCLRCGLRTDDIACDGYYGQRITPEEVAAVWNRRAEKCPT